MMSSWVHTHLLTSPTCTADNEEWPVTPQRYLSIFITLSEACAVTTMMMAHDSQTGHARYRRMGFNCEYQNYEFFLCS